MIKKMAERTGLALVLAGSLLAVACGEENSAEKAGQQAGKKIDEAAETVRKSAGDFVEQAEKKAQEAAESIGQKTRQVLEEAERKADKTGSAMKKSVEDARRTPGSTPVTSKDHSKP